MTVVGSGFSRTIEQPNRLLRRGGTEVHVALRRRVVRVSREFLDDDHVKNIAFLMNKAGQWSLAPAFDVTCSYNPSGNWTDTHRMTINAKRARFQRADIRAAGKSAGLKQGRADALLAEVTEAVARWPEFAAKVSVLDDVAERIRMAHRLEL